MRQYHLAGDRPEDIKSMNAGQSVEIVGEGNAAIALFKSTCLGDADEIARASTQIREYVERNQPDTMVFDFAGVKFISSQVLGLLLEARAHQRAHGGHVVLCTLGAQLHRVFRITNLDRIFTFHADRETALRAIAGER
jgi:anti-anti-sigma factor